MAQQIINIGTANNSGNGDPLRSAFDKINDNFTELYTNYSSNIVVVNQPSDFGIIDSNKVYLINGNIDMGATSIEVPSGGITIQGYDFNTSSLTSSSNSYTMFTSPVGGSGDVLMKDMSFTVSGTSSRLFNLVSDTGNEAIEISRVNFNNCTSLGIFDNYRQVFESGTGRFGGTPEIELRNLMSGYRISASIALGMFDFTSLFKAGTGLYFLGRVAIELNCDLPITGALIDFSDSNIANNESLQLQNCRITREGILDTTDTTIYPNITQDNVKSLWSGNVGIPNTYKYIKGNITTETTTNIALVNTYYPLEGTFTITQESHFDMPNNGVFRLLSGNGIYQFSGDIVLDGTADNEIDIRITKSTDGGSTFPTVINHIKRTINNLSGGRDVAFFPLNFISSLVEGDRVRIEVENKTTPVADVTAEVDSFIIISQI